MFLGNVINWTSVVGQDIPFVTARNTNDRITNENGVITFNKAGNYNIDCSLVLSGTGQIVVSTLKDGVEDTTTYAETELSEDVTFGNVMLIDAIKVTPADIDSKATFSVRVDTAGVTVNGKIRIEYIQ